MDDHFKKAVDEWIKQFDKRVGELEDENARVKTVIVAQDKQITNMTYIMDYIIDNTKDLKLSKILEKLSKKTRKS